MKNSSIIYHIILSGKAPGRRMQNGSALVEYAFSVTIFLSLVFGIGGFGHALYVYHYVNNAAKEASRWAAVNGYFCGNLGDNSCNGTYPMNNGPASGGQNTGDIDNYIRSHVSSGINGTKGATSSTTPLSTNATWSATTGSPTICTTAVGGVGPYSNYPGCTVDVTVGYALNFVFPLLPTSKTVTSPCTAAGFCLSSTSEMVISH